MPRTLSGDLATMLERANPNVQRMVEVNTPDTGLVLRRPDQLLGANLVSVTPPGALVAASSGGVQLAPTPAPIVSVLNPTAGQINLDPVTIDRYLNAMAFYPSPAFQGCLLRQVRAVVARVPIAPFNTIIPVDYAFNIYRATGVPQVFYKGSGDPSKAGSRTPSIQWTFTPLIAQDVVVPYASITTWGYQGGDGNAAVIAFDLSLYQIVLENTQFSVPTIEHSGEISAYYLTVRAVNPPRTGLARWGNQAGGAVTAPGIGKFQRESWFKDDNAADPAARHWVQTIYPTECMCLELDVDTYPSGATTAIYAITLPTLPLATGQGRVVIEKSVPPGTSIGVLASLGGPTGPWTPVQNQDAINGPDAPFIPRPAAQQNYWLKVILGSTFPHRRTPFLHGLGIEYRTTYDVSLESITKPLEQSVSVPFLSPSIGDGSLQVLRSGVRDYEDVGSQLAVSAPTTRQEVDIYLGSTHPSVTRSEWLHQERASVSSREPTPTGETLTLLSYAKALKRKIPFPVERIATTHTVLAGTTQQKVLVTPNLIGSALDAYDNAGYYIRVQSSAQPGVATGYLQGIDGNTGPNQLDFGNPLGNQNPIGAVLPGIFALGDRIEVHSGDFQQPVLTWVDADPADIWYQLLSVYLGIPDDRIGLSDVDNVGNGGRPPTAAQRAPGDLVTQAKLKVTMQLTQSEAGSELLDQLSFLMGGATLCIRGQIVYRQIYPVRAPNGAVVLAGNPASFVFDPTEYFGLKTPTGVEQRITTARCTYGVDLTSAKPDSIPAQTVIFTDPDAENSLNTQEVEGLGFTDILAKIARWCFNSADGGQYLATSACMQVVTAFSTGLRVWPWSAVEAYPDACVGDTAIVITDQYTDFDPATGLQVKGWFAFALTLVYVAGDGRSFKGIMQGLPQSAARIRGGPASLQGPNAAIASPAITLSVDAVYGANGASAKVKITWSLASPFLAGMDYSVRASADGGVTYGAPSLYKGGTVGLDTIPADFGITYEVTPITVSEGGTRTPGTPVVVTVGANPFPTPVFAAPAADASFVYDSWVYDEVTVRMERWYVNTASDPGAGPFDNTAGAVKLPDLYPADGQLTNKTAVSSGLPWAGRTYIAYDRNGVRQSFSFDTQRNAGATNPAPPVSAAATSHTSTSITATVTLAGSNIVGDVIQPYANGVAAAGAYTLVSGDVSLGTVSITVTGLAASTPYSLTFSTIRSGVESTTRSTAASDTTSAPSVVTPTSLSATREVHDSTQADLSWSAAGNPPGGTYTVQSATNSGFTTGVSTKTGITSTSTVRPVTSAQTWFRVRYTYGVMTSSNSSSANIPAFTGHA